MGFFALLVWDHTNISTCHANCEEKVESELKLLILLKCSVLLLKESLNHLELSQLEHYSPDIIRSYVKCLVRIIFPRYAFLCHFCINSKHRCIPSFQNLALRSSVLNALSFHVLFVFIRSLSAAFRQPTLHIYLREVLF